MENDIVYSINITDIQTVATEKYNRELREDEIKQIIDKIGEKIDWYYAIYDSIVEAIGLPDDDTDEVV